MEIDYLSLVRPEDEHLTTNGWKAIQNNLNEFYMALNEVARQAEETAKQLSENMEWARTLKFVYNEKIRRAPNNWLKMHGYPMRRRYVCKHTNQRRRRKC